MAESAVTAGMVNAQCSTRRQQRLRTWLVAHVLIVSVHPAAAQAPGASQDRQPVPQRPEEIAAVQLIEKGQRREALAQLDLAFSAYRRANDHQGLARIARRRSEVRQSLSELDRAARDAEHAVTYSRDDEPLLVQSLTQLGRVLMDRGDYPRAEAALGRALAIAERRNDWSAQTTVLRNLANLMDRRGAGTEGLGFAARAVAAADRSGDVAARVRARGTITPMLLSVSRYDDALASAQESYDIAEASGVAALRAAARFDLAQAQAHVWNLDRAAELWSETITAHREIGNRTMLALALKQSVETWFALGEFDRAAADGEQAVALLGATGQTYYVAEALARLALSHVRAGRNADAEHWAEAARNALAQTPQSRHLFVHNDLGLIAVEQGNRAAARQHFQQVRAIAERVGNVEYMWRADWGEGRVAITDNPTDAVAPLERAIATVERLRQTIPEAGLRAAFMINRVGPYQTLAEAHMAMASEPTDDNVRRALEVSDRARSRALADLLAEARARSSNPGVRVVRDQETEFGRRFSVVQRRVASAVNAEERARGLGALRELEREYEAFVVRLRRDNAAYASLAYPASPTAAALGAMLGDDEALVEFLVTDAYSFGWVVRRNGVRGYRIPGKVIIDRQVRLLTALVAAGDEAAIKRLGAELYEQLLRPAEPLLNATRRLVIVADGALQRIPFALLRSRDRWLVETHAIALAPSAAILHVLRQTRPAHAPEPLLALAAPHSQPAQVAIFDRLPNALDALTHAEVEATEARTALRAPSDAVRTGAAATEAALKSADAQRYRVLHLATHAVADEIVPRRSAVLLTPTADDDGLLQVSEIANLSLNADLVVLAACRSHVGRVIRGEGLLSLGRAFMHAGARAVVATTRDVPDRETAWLMRELYLKLGAGLPPDEALRQAQLRAVQSGGAAGAPHVWSAFVVFGDATTPVFDTKGRTDSWTAAVVPIALIALATAAVLIAVRARRPKPTDGPQRTP